MYSSAEIYIYIWVCNNENIYNCKDELRVGYMLIHLEESGLSKDGNNLLYSTVHALAKLISMALTTSCCTCDVETDRNTNFQHIQLQRFKKFQ